MNLIKIAVLDMNNSHANEGMRCILHAIRNIQGSEPIELALDIFDVRSKDEVPDLEYDIYISSGGPGSPLASPDHWEAHYFELIDQIIDWNKHNDRKKYVFLICHSFQLVVRHLDLGLLSRRKSTSFGIFPVHKTEEGIDETLLEGLPDPFFAVDSRDFQITEPNMERLDEMGASILCLEKIRPHVLLERAVMAIRFSPEIIGTQFHPEADNEGMLRYFLQDEKRNHIVLNFGQEKYDAMVSYLQDPDKIALTESIILPGFLRQAIEELTATDLFLEQN
ncbi:MULTISPECIES: homoserine O-succinyltransferase [unclassified Spirosoma]|uniref:type 1 glutamine amidotransferase n=1 Tax=unclassified Spirosoma TaxID=2621999 RepID=UPI00095F44DE|nr:MULTISPECIES: homoserine O-succinyltransferase [unclassified Spirosoma]MBN8821173.1 homoserine O-succinyltransferase [Spirosoma sp.]OJW79196.1 MAG: GMP synthase [Spirosoma sp. 48-14]